MRRQGVRPASQRGQASAEYLALVLIAASLVGALVATSLGSRIAGTITTALDCVRVEGCAGADDPTPGDDPADPDAPPGEDEQALEAALRALPPGTQVIDGETGEVLWEQGDGLTGDPRVDEVLRNLALINDYLAQTYGRDSFDGDGAPFVMTLDHREDPSRPWRNAHWRPDELDARFGEGFATLDVMAHEYGHALVQFTAGLHYAGQGAALHESLSDILASNVDTSSWVIGEDVPGGPIRDLSDPAHVDDYVGEGHADAEITNHAYYQMVEGVGDLGRDRAAQIVYRAMTDHLEPDAGLEDFREATLAAAGELYGEDSPEYEGVEASMAEVGLDGTWDGP